MEMRCTKGSLEGFGFGFGFGWSLQAVQVDGVFTVQFAGRTGGQCLLTYIAYWIWRARFDRVFNQQRWAGAQIVEWEVHAGEDFQRVIAARPPVIPRSREVLGAITNRRAS